jgi:hypothetical protein
VIGFADVLEASVFAEQMRNVGGRLDVARTGQAFRGWAMRNGVLLKPALAQRVDLPPFRIDGYLSNFERVLIVDGYPVVSVDDSDAVRLDIDLLKKQFGWESRMVGPQRTQRYYRRTSCGHGAQARA